MFYSRKSSDYKIIVFNSKTIRLVWYNFYKLSYLRVRSVSFGIGCCEIAAMFDIYFKLTSFVVVLKTKFYFTSNGYCTIPAFSGTWVHGCHRIASGLWTIFKKKSTMRRYNNTFIALHSVVRSVFLEYNARPIQYVQRETKSIYARWKKNFKTSSAVQ